MKSLMSVFLVIVMAISCFFGGFAEISSDVTEIDPLFSGQALSYGQETLLADFVDRETAWIASLQLDNGAIPMTAAKNGDVTVNPYFADIAAMALLDCGDKYKDNVKAYLDWHFSHLNTDKTDYNGIDGTVYDYSITVSQGKVIKETVSVKDGNNSYDSTDSYAATFLILLNKYFSVTDDSDYIAENAEDIIRVSEAMLSTLNNGLTFAKPDYEVKYLMDNCEVYEGLQAVMNLFDKVIYADNKNNLIYIKFDYAAEWIKQGLEKHLWNADGEYYYSAVFKNGKPAYDFSWDEFYPSAAAQLFPIIHNVLPSDSVRAVALYNSFCEAYNWQSLEIPSEFCWGAMALAAAKMNDIDSVLSYISSYSSYAAERAYPLYNADAARVCMAAAYLLNK